MKKNTTFRHRMVESVTMFVVSSVSLLLLVYIGFGEGQRTYQQFYLDKLAAQARVIQISLENYLRPGLPLTQYVGFTTKAEPFAEADSSIAALAVFDNAGAQIFGAGDRTIPLLPASPDLSAGQSSDYQVHGSDEFVQVILPLRTRFEVVGSLAITMERSVVATRLQQSFTPLLYTSGVLSLFFAAFVAFGGPWFAKFRFPMLHVGFAVTFITMAVFVIGTLIALYSEGTQAKAKALADSLAQRLSDLVQFNLDLDGIQGLDQIFDNYLRLNPDISAAGLALGGEVKITDQDQLNGDWMPWSGTYHYIVDLTPAGSDQDISVFVTLPEGVVYQAVIRSVKNFAALFVASAFLSGVFMQVAQSMQRQRMREKPLEPEIADVRKNDSALSIVKPVFFLAVLVEHLTYAFLPQYFHGIVESSGLSESFVSAPFMAFYLFFAISLVPAGHFAQQFSPKPLMCFGLLLAAFGLALLAMPMDIYAMIVARSISGVGQGILFIGVQSYILAMASPDRKTQGAGIIVFGFQGGMISGMAVGSLLVNYIGPQNVFAVAAAVAACVAFYALAIVPSIQREVTGVISLKENLAQMGRNVARVMRDLQFLRTMFLIGIPAKAILTGVIIFALPLLLSARGYAQEDIGQIIMVYAAGVIIASGAMSRVADRIGNTHSILVAGAIISGIGLIMIGSISVESLVESENDDLIEAMILILGVAIVGVAHGFINAPVVTHVADSSLGQSVGSSTVTATYRFLERAGHTAGPIIVGQLFVFVGLDAMLLTWIGGAVIILGVLFIFRGESTRALRTGILPSTE